MSDDQLNQLVQRVRDFSNTRNWAQFHDPKNLSMAIASEAGELAAVLRWVSNTASDVFATQGAVRARLLDEIGDIGILLIEMCNRLDIDLCSIIDHKLKVNERLYPVATALGNPERDKKGDSGAPCPDCGEQY